MHCDPGVPTVSLVIPAWNEATYLPRLLDTVEAARRAYRRGPQGVEVIVADNDSTDETPQIAAVRGCRVEHVAKRLIAAARNGGAAAARGEILAFADADFRLHPETFNYIDCVMERADYAGGATGITMERWSLGILATWYLIMPPLWLIYDDVRFVEQGREANLASNGDFQRGDASPECWHFQNWTGGKNVRSAYVKRGGRDDSACVRIEVDALDPSTRGYANDHAAVYDWTLFWNETAAEYINRMSALVKRFDTTRKTVSYLTYAFAFPAEWDYAQQVAIAPDEVARRGRDIDVLGMQLCSADGDPFRTTCCLDVVRKYRKPMWVVDLVDFTSGVHIGLPAMEKATQLAIAHGAEGIVYCGWHLTFVQDYSYWPAFGQPGLRRMVTQAQAAIARTRGLTVQPAAALVHTMMPLSAQDGPEGKNDFRSFLGWYKAMESIQETFDVVTLRELELDPARLGRYRYVVTPDCAHLPRGSLAALKGYSDRGGVLVSAGRFAKFDEFGRPSLDALRGAVARIELADDGRAVAGSLRRDTHAGNTPPLFLWHGEAPEVRAALARASASLICCKEQRGIPAAVTLREPAPDVRCVQWTGKDRQLVFLVNMGKLAAEGRQLLVRDMPPGKVRVLADLEQTPCPAAWEGNLLRVALPRFQTCCLVEVSGPAPTAAKAKTAAWSIANP